MATKEKPSTSKQGRLLEQEAVLQNDNDDEGIRLNIDDEEVEISRLQLPPKEQRDEAEEAINAKPKAEEDERIARIEFHCSACDMHEMVHYFGQSPPFVYGLSFPEDTYVMRDPFQPPPPRWKPKAEYFVAMGAQCVRCQRTVCRDAACSFFYTRTHCLACATQQIAQIPVEAQAKLRKQLAMK